MNSSDGRETGGSTVDTGTEPSKSAMPSIHVGSAPAYERRHPVDTVDTRFVAAFASPTRSAVNPILD